jgi:hypothetical protein
MSRSTANLYVGANHQLTFGKHKGKLLGDLIDEDYSYILYLHNKKILKIEHWIVDKCWRLKQKYIANTTPDACIWDTF